MTASQKKSFGVFTGALVTFVIFIATVIYVAGGQGRTIGFNTERIKRVEHNMEKSFGRVYEQLDRIESKIH